MPEKSNGIAGLYIYGMSNKKLECTAGYPDA